MSKFAVKLAEKREVARDTLSFELDLSGNRFEFLPGQFLEFYLPDNLTPNYGQNAHAFSIASDPGDEYVCIATRIRKESSFKQGMRAMQPGDQPHIAGAHGTFTMDAPEGTPLVFVAGGIGVTPFRSMIRHSLQRDMQYPILLICSNRTPEDAPFLRELQDLADAQANFQLLATMTRPEMSRTKWNGPVGHVDATFLQKNVREPGRVEYYVAGPPRFVASVCNALETLKIPRERVHSEEFVGY